MRLEPVSQALLDENRLEHRLDRARLPDDALNPGPATSFGGQDEIADVDFSRALPVQRDRHARREVRLTDEELAPPLDLDDDPLSHLRLSRSWGAAGGARPEGTVWFDTGPERIVPSAASGGRGARLRRAGAAAGQGRESLIPGGSGAS